MFFLCMPGRLFWRSDYLSRLTAHLRHTMYSTHIPACPALDCIFILQADTLFFYVYMLRIIHRLLYDEIFTRLLSPSSALYDIFSELLVTGVGKKCMCLLLVPCYYPSHEVPLMDNCCYPRAPSQPNTGRSLTRKRASPGVATASS